MSDPFILSRGIRKPFLLPGGSIDPSSIDIELVYRYIDNMLKPMWEVKYGKYVFYYDIDELK